MKQRLKKKNEKQLQLNTTQFQAVSTVFFSVQSLAISVHVCVPGPQG